MAVSTLDQARTQVKQICTFCDFCDRLPLPPVTMPPDAVRAAGLDPDIWHGLGVVGLWAALDAFAARCSPSTSWADWRTRLPQDLADAVCELEDMRNLYAHNFGGVADDVYFSPKFKRYMFKQGVPHLLSSGTGSSFDGQRLTLALADLRFYIEKVSAILEWSSTALSPG